MSDIVADDVQLPDGCKKVASHLRLSKPLAVFDPHEKGPLSVKSISSNAVSVFFDHILNQLFVVRSLGVTGVSVFTALSSNSPLLPPGGALKHSQFTISSTESDPIRSIKQSSDEQCLTIKRSNHSNHIEMLMFNEKNNAFEFSFFHPCKTKNSKIQEFYWIANCQLLIITNLSVEYYSVNIPKKQVKLVKNVMLTVSWSNFNLLPTFSTAASRPQSGDATGTASSTSSSAAASVVDYQGLLIVATPDQHNILHPFIFKSGTSSGSITKLAKFEIDMPMSSKRPGQKQVLIESSLYLLNVYDEAYVSVIKKQTFKPGSAKPSSELVLYRISREAPAKKSYVLKLASEAGSFAVNVVDNLIIVHYQEKQVSLLFDIKIGGESDGFVTKLNPLFSPTGIEQVAPIIKPNSATSINVLLYDRAWVVFRPDVIINPQIGVMWRLTADMNEIASKFTTNRALLKFLQLRYNSRQFQLDLLKKFFSEKSVTLAEVAELFDISNDAYKKFLEHERGMNNKSNGGNHQTVYDSSPCSFHSNSVLHQSDMLTIFEDILDQPVVSPERSRFIVAVMMEFIKSLESKLFQVDYKVEDVLVSHLVRTGQYYQLHQLLQYYVIKDRRQMALKLLTLHNDYPPAIQLALDMLKRIGVSSHTEILELLLSRQEVITAINFAKKFNLIDDLKRPDKFLEVAKAKGDRVLFYSTYKFFEDFNNHHFRQRKLLQSQKCEQYTEHFKKLFGENSLNEFVSIVQERAQQLLPVF